MQLMENILMDGHCLSPCTSKCCNALKIDRTNFDSQAAWKVLEKLKFPLIKILCYAVYMKTAYFMTSFITIVYNIIVIIMVFCHIFAIVFFMYIITYITGKEVIFIINFIIAV